MTGAGESGVEADGDVPFAAAMAAAGPFEPRPRLAVALSGGADSTALLLLAEGWARARGGDVLALVVDHGLRDGSAAEAAEVAHRCAARGIAHRVLRWEGPRPSRRIQERAREARYRLLEDACAEEGILHLLLGHHAGDQDETIAMRRARRSGEAGLAGMALDTPRARSRILRPLLAVEPGRLRAWLGHRGASWIEDPSNGDPRFLRARMRLGGPRARLAPGAPRALADAALADWLGRHAAVHPEGWVELEREAFVALAPPFARAVLRAVVLAVSGAIHPPRGASLGLATSWALSRGVDPARRCFAGCLLVRGTAGIAILRDPALPRAACLSQGQEEVVWDRRFRIRLDDGAPSGGRVAPLADSTACPAMRGRGPAAMASRVLPALQSLDGSWHVPHLFCGRGSVALVSVPRIDVAFRPARKLAGGAFAGLPAAGPSATQASRRPSPGKRRRRSPEKESQP
jgi:tRNA(Ile)-lysidine synthase